MLLLFALCDLGALFPPDIDWDLHAEGLQERREGSRDIGVGVEVCVRVGAGAGASANVDADMGVGKWVSWESVSTGEGDREE
jgi:hypothetical protein